MSKILDKMRRVKKNKEDREQIEQYRKDFKNHPVANESIEIKIHYLNGLALMMNVDDEISQTENYFISLLMEAFDITDSVMEDFLKFAQDPEDDDIEELFEELSKTEEVKIWFIVDCYYMAKKDEVFREEEKALLDMFLEMLNFEEEVIDYLSEIIKSCRLVEYMVIICEIVEECYSAEEAFKWFKLSAEQGDSIGQFNLGRRYMYGWGVEKNKTEAIKWYKLSAEQGNSEAQKKLGKCYMYGWGVEENETEAVKWYELSAEQGDSEAQNELGFCYRCGYKVEKNESEAFKWYKLSAEQGDSNGQCELGVCFNLGIGVEKNESEAFKWCSLSAEQGYSYGQYELGNCFYEGNGTEKNYSKAYKWYKLSAEQGLSYGQYHLGKCYHYGNGIVQNDTEAKKMYKLSAEQGNSDAKEALEKYFPNS